MQSQEKLERATADVLTLRQAAVWLRLGLPQVARGLVVGELPIGWRGGLPGVDRVALQRRLNPYGPSNERGGLR